MSLSLLIGSKGGALSHCCGTFPPSALLCSRFCQVPICGSAFRHSYVSGPNFDTHAPTPACTARPLLNSW